MEGDVRRRSLARVQHATGWRVLRGVEDPAEVFVQVELPSAELAGDSTKNWTSPVPVASGVDSPASPAGYSVNTPPFWLAEDDRGLAELFGEETGDEVDKFERCSWRPGPGDVPVLDGVKGWIAGPVVGRFDVGDHVAFVVEPEAGVDDEPAARPLGFQTAKGIEPGHEP